MGWGGNNMHQLAEPHLLILGTATVCFDSASRLTVNHILQHSHTIYKAYYAPLFPELKVNDWRDTKLELNYLFYSVTVKVCCQLENEYKLINSIFIWQRCRGVGVVSLWGCPNV